MIEHLPTLAPDPSRGARTLAKCHARLAAQRRRAEARSRERLSTVKTKPVLVEGLLLAGVSVVYLVSMAGNVVRLLPSGSFGWLWPR
jgi:hypothetical protein